MPLIYQKPQHTSFFLQLEDDGVNRVNINAVESNGDHICTIGTVLGDGSLELRSISSDLAEAYGIKLDTEGYIFATYG